MNGKRHSIGKSTGHASGKSTDKSKEMLSGVKHKSEQDWSHIPLIKQCDNGNALPKYSSVLCKTTEDGVNMDDLDLLQQDLEKLLSSSACRTRFLLAELESMDKVEESRDKKDKLHEKTPLKRKRPDDKSSKRKKPKGTNNRVIKKHGLPVNHLVGDHLRHELPKVDNPIEEFSRETEIKIPELGDHYAHEFWASVEPYCSNVSKDDIVFLDNLIEEFSKETDIKIPELGDHYAHEWSEELMSEEQSMGTSPRSKPIQNIDIKKIGLLALENTLPRAQRLLAEENTDKLKTSDLNLKNNGPRVGVCMDRKLEQGILNLEELPKGGADDEILTEIRKCQEELKTVNQYNLEELKKLKSIVQSDLQKLQVREVLQKIDKQVPDLYNRVLLAKKQAQQAEGDGEDVDKSVLAQQFTHDFESLADSMLKQQIMLHSWAYPEYNANIPQEPFFAESNK